MYPNVNILNTNFYSQIWTQSLNYELEQGWSLKL